MPEDKDLREEIMARYDYDPHYIKSMLDEYADARMKQLLQFLALNEVDSDITDFGTKDQVPVFKYKEEWITLDELFNNFL